MFWCIHMMMMIIILINNFYYIYRWCKNIYNKRFYDTVDKIKAKYVLQKMNNN